MGLQSYLIRKSKHDSEKQIHIFNYTTSYSRINTNYKIPLGENPPVVTKFFKYTFSSLTMNDIAIKNTNLTIRKNIFPRQKLAKKLFNVIEVRFL